MARPPRLEGTIPTVTADWQWSGVWPVTTDAVLTGAWQLPAAKRKVLICVNVSDQPVSATFNPATVWNGIPAGPSTIRKITAAGKAVAEFPEELNLPPQ